MNKLDILFSNKNKDLLSVYFTAGHPKIESTKEIILGLQKAGVDFIEVGMPFSDPMADGPTIQMSSEKALKNGMNLDIYFEQLKSIYHQITVPLIAMGYVNQMLTYGVENFLKKCSEVGISGLILPDLPLEVYRQHYSDIFAAYSIANIFLITPQTSDARIKEIDTLSSSFIYVVSSSSTTGKSDNLQQSQIDYFKRISQMNLKSPLVVGFGISDHLSYSKVCKFSCGAIVGSAFVKEIDHNLSPRGIENFVNKIKIG